MLLANKYIYFLNLLISWASKSCSKLSIKKKKQTNKQWMINMKQQGRCVWERQIGLMMNLMGDKIIRFSSFSFTPPTLLLSQIPSRISRFTTQLLLLPPFFPTTPNPIAKLFRKELYILKLKFHIYVTWNG